MKLNLITDKPDFRDDLCEEARLFLPVRKIEDGYTEEGLLIVHSSAGNSHRAELFEDGRKAAEYSFNGRDTEGLSALEKKRYFKRAAKSCIYGLLSKYTGKSPPWGSLTGVRPTKLFRDTAGTAGIEGALELFKDEFHVSDGKTALLRDIYYAQKDVLDQAGSDDIDIYIGIPICVSKCAYCTFSSVLTSKDGSMEKKYTDSLIRQIEASYPLIEGRKVRSVYIGGGTPTALPAHELERVLEAAGRIAGGCEFTVEAGRPDTIDEEKLSLIKEAGADRISVNAQTTSDMTLRRIGRAHTAEDFFEKIELAAGFGFRSINCDLIAGLPGEDAKTVEKSIREVIGTGASNITVHSLALKRASRFVRDNEDLFMDSKTAEETVSTAQEILRENGYTPYYMYRQKYMTGNLENCGYEKNRDPCIYNIDIMEEAVDILAMGGGGISKRILRGDRKIVRSALVKDVLSYILRTDEMTERNYELFGRNR